MPFHGNSLMLKDRKDIMAAGTGDNMGAALRPGLEPGLQAWRGSAVDDEGGDRMVVMVVVPFQ